MLINHKSFKKDLRKDPSSAVSKSLGSLVNMIDISTSISMKLKGLKINIFDELSSEMLQDIEVFRKKTMGGCCPYLYSDSHFSKINESLIDQQSIHFTITKSGNIVGHLRLNPSQTELKTLLPNKNLSNYSSYLEISRFCVDRSALGIGKYLLINAGVFQYQKTDAIGLLALCPKKYQKTYQSFGLQSIVENIEIDYRPHIYSVMAAQTEEMAKNVFKKIPRSLLQ